MKKFITNKYVLTILGSILFFLAWIIISYSIDERMMIFPDPFSTIQETFRILGTSYVYHCLLWTMIRMFIGFGISFILALLFGALAGHFPSLKTLFGPTITVLKSVPTAALVFLFLVIIGAKYAPILVVILISFPILYESISAGINNIPEEIINASKIDGSKGLSTILRIRLPLSIPYILVGVASSFALSFKIEIMAEIITGDTSHGIGSAIFYAKQSNPANMVPIFAYSLIAIILVLLLTVIEDIVTRLVKKYY